MLVQAEILRLQQRLLLLLLLPSSCNYQGLAATSQRLA
jgi:hypothetical protein